MKKIFYLLLVLLCIQTASASTRLMADTIPILSKDDFLSKAKRQRTGAVISLTGGILTSTFGGLVAISGGALFFFETIGSGISGEEPDSRIKTVRNVGVGLFLLGTAAIVTSIILFRQSSKNKKIAVSMTTQSVRQLQSNGIVRTVLPSIRVTIDL